MQTHTHTLPVFILAAATFDLCVCEKQRDKRLPEWLLCSTFISVFQNPVMCVGEMEASLTVEFEKPRKGSDKTC